MILFYTKLKSAFFYFSEQNMERDNFMTPEKAKEFGLIDAVLSRPPVIEDEKKPSETT